MQHFATLNDSTDSDRSETTIVTITSLRVTIITVTEVTVAVMTVCPYVLEFAL